MVVEPLRWQTTASSIDLVGAARKQWNTTRKSVAVQKDLETRAQSTIFSWLATQ